MNAQEEIVAAPPPGFIEIKFDGGDHFVNVVGPLWGKRDGKKLLLGIRVTHRHCNIAGICHGGMLMTLADMQLSLGTRLETEEQLNFTPTISMTADFLAPAPLGAWIEGRTDLLRTTRNFLFSQCIITSNGAPAVRASGIMKTAGAPAAVRGLPNIRTLFP